MAQRPVPRWPLAATNARHHQHHNMCTANTTFPRQCTEDRSQQCQPNLRQDIHARLPCHCASFATDPHAELSSYAGQCTLALSTVNWGCARAFMHACHPSMGTWMGSNLARPAMVMVVCSRSMGEPSAKLLGREGRGSGVGEESSRRILGHIRQHRHTKLSRTLVLRLKHLGLHLGNFICKRIALGRRRGQHSVVSTRMPHE